MAEVIHPGGPTADPATGTEAALPPPPTRSPRRRWLRRLLILVVFGVGLYLCRAPILKGVASWLVVVEPVPNPTAVLVLNSGGYPQFAELYRSRPDCQVIVFDYPPSRLVQMGILPTNVALARDAIRRGGVPETALLVLEAPSPGNWDLARRLGPWLADHPDAIIVIWCGRFEGRRLRYILNAVMQPEAAGRVHVQARASGSYDETNWWRSKEGKLSIFGASIHLAHAWLHGDDTSERIRWNPDQYEQTLSPAP